MKKICIFIWRMVYPLLLYQVIVEIIFLGIDAFRPELADTWELQISSAGALAAVIPMMLLYMDCKKKKVLALEAGPGAGEARPEPFGHAQSFTIHSMILMAELGCCLCLLLNTILMELPISWEAMEKLDDILYDPPVTIQLICVGLIIPLAEELVFRGLGYYKMRSMAPAFPCILISAAYFGAIHGSVIQGLYASILGMVLAGVMEWYGTLTAPYLLHASANMMSVLISNTLIGGLIGAFRPVRMIMIALCLIWLFKILKDIIRRDGVTQ